MEEMTADTARGQALSPEAQKINEIIKHLNKTEPGEGVGGVEQLGRTRLTRADHHRKINELVREVNVLRQCMEQLNRDNTLELAVRTIETLLEKKP